MNDKIYYNGYIITMEEPMYAQAMHIKDGIIKRIGTYEEIIKYKGVETEIVDLQGKTMLPAFIDSHSHFILTAKSFSICRLENVKSNSELVEKLKEYIKLNRIKSNTDRFIIGFGYDNNNLESNLHLNNTTLDEVSKDIPILIIHISGHMGVVNSRGMGLLELDKLSDGFLKESECLKKVSNVWKQNSKEMLEYLKLAEEKYLSEGITTVQEGLLKKDDLKIIEDITSNNKFNVDIISYLDYNSIKNITDSDKLYERKYVNRFKIGGFKLILDGLLQSRTAWTSESYNNTDIYGTHEYSNEELDVIIKDIFKNNKQVLIHCNGDRAIEQCIDVLNENKKILSKNDLRPVMLNPQLIQNKQLNKVKELGLIVSYCITDNYYFKDIYIKNLGDKVTRINPLYSTIVNDIKFTLNQELSIGSVNIFESIWYAVTRNTKSNDISNDKNDIIEKIDVYNALKAVTINSAYQNFEEDIKGSLKQNKLADLIIVDKNPLLVSPDEIKSIKVLETIKEGKTVYKYKD